MRFKRRILDYALAVLLLLLPVFMLRGSLREPEERSGLDNFVLRVTSPLQAAASWIVEGVGGLWNDYIWLVDVEAENDELRAVNRQLREELLVHRETAGQLEQLRRLLGLRQKIPSETAAAHVVAASINPHFRVNRIRIDRGQELVGEGMPVINADGLVGRIHNTYGGYSDVLLLSDTQSAIDVVVPSTGGRGLLTGLGRDDSYECQIEYLEQGRPVHVGDSVVTSGLGTSFPEGLLVGTIVAVDSQQQGLYQSVTVRPAVNLSSLGPLLVLVAPPAARDPNADEFPPSQSAYGVRAF